MLHPMSDALVPPTGRNFQTKQALVYHTLREAIMQARLVPGERLVIDDIAKKLEVSAIPVREALQQLMSERLVEHRPHIGAVVTAITPEATREIFTLLEALETAAFRLAVERADPAAVADLRRLVERMAGSDGERWIEHNRRFHRTFAEIAAMPRLLEALDRVSDDWERLRRYAFLNAGGPDRAGADREHLAMVEALVARDVPRLEQLVRDHNRSALASYLAR